MDLKSLIEELNARKAVLETAIVTLREIQQSISGSPPRPKVDGRGGEARGFRSDETVLGNTARFRRFPRIDQLIASRHVMAVHSSHGGEGAALYFSG